MFPTFSTNWMRLFSSPPELKFGKRRVASKRGKGEKELPPEGGEIAVFSFSGKTCVLTLENFSWEMIFRLCFPFFCAGGSNSAVKKLFCWGKMKNLPFSQTFLKQKGGCVVFLEKSSADFARKKYKKGSGNRRDSFGKSVSGNAGFDRKKFGKLFCQRIAGDTNWKANNFRNLCFRTH